MMKDPTEFRDRFARWKTGEKVYENGLPKYGDGTTNVIPEDLQGLSDPQFQPQINEAKVRMTPFVVDDTAHRAQKYHPGTTREQVQELYNNTPYVGSYNKGMLASPSVGAYFSNRDDYPFIRIGQNKPYEIDQMIAHESGHALEDLLFHGRTQQELDLLNKAYGGIPGTKYNEFGQLNRELRHLISKNNNNVIGKDLDNIITNMKDKDLLWLLKNNNLGYTKSAGQTPNLDASAIKRALLDVAQNKYTFDQGNGLMLAKNGKQAVLPLYGGGKSTKKGNYYLPGEKIRRELDVPYDNSSYDYRRANQLGYEPDETGHMPSRDWITGRYLKTPTHPTESLSIYTDLGLGYDVFDKYGNTYSQPNWGSTWESRLPGYKRGKGQYDHTVNFLKQHEGFKDTTYLDGNGVPTIGYGFTDSSLVKKGRISKSEADRQLVREIEKREGRLSKLKNWNNLSEDSKTALRSYYYNYPAGFGKDTKFIRYWNAGDYERAINEVDAGINDKNNPGLRKRRLQEQKMLRQDPFLKTPVRSQIGPVEQMMDNSPRFIPQPIIVPATTQPDYSIQTMVEKSIPATLNSRNNGDSPIYGGNDYSFRMPSLKEYIERNLMRPQW